MRGMAIAGLLLISALDARADVELRSDSYTPGDGVAFDPVIQIGEMVATRFVAPEAGRELLRIRFLDGDQGGTDVVTVDVHIWDDTQSLDAPGAEIGAFRFTLRSDGVNLQDFDIHDIHLALPRVFRIGVEFLLSGLPTVGRDKDDTHVGRNYFFDDNHVWRQSQIAGLPGDWIIRAVVSGDATTDVDTNGADAGVMACAANPDCPVGEFCDLDHHICTFACRGDADCASGHCNSLGLCVEVPATTNEGGGCCQSSGGTTTPLAAIVIALGFRARRASERTRSRRSRCRASDASPLRAA